MEVKDLLKKVVAAVEDKMANHISWQTQNPSDHVQEHP